MEGLMLLGFLGLFVDIPGWILRPPPVTRRDALVLDKYGNIVPLGKYVWNGEPSRRIVRSRVVDTRIQSLD